MTSTKLAAVGLVSALLAFGSVAWATAGSEPVQKAAGEAALVEIKTVDLDANLDALKLLEQQGYLKLAGREETVGLLYAWAPALRALEAKGIAYHLLTGDLAGLELYLVPKLAGVSRGTVEAVARVLEESDGYYLVGTEAGRVSDPQALPAKQLLPGPYEAGIPLRTVRAANLQPGACGAEAMTYNPRIQTLVDAVSQSNLYDLLSGLSGEHAITIGGSPYTISTRYSSTEGCKEAAQWLKERFEALGIQAEYDYFNFLKFMRSVDFPTDNVHGWAVGASLILYTDDGGQVWTKLEDGTDASLASVFMLDNQTGWIAGSAGTILVTHDGLSWQKSTTPVTNDLKEVFFVDAMTGYACGASGTILKSLDGGQSWTKLTSGTTANLNAIWFVSLTDGWVVGDGGVIRKTANGGASWQTASSPVTSNLSDVSFASPTVGVIDGLGGTILRTTDGASWQKLTSPVTDALYGVFFLDQARGWICGYGGSLLRTSDAGATWTDLSTYLDFQLTSISFANPNDGWVVGNACVLHSADGGTTWVSQNDNVQVGDINVVATIPGTVKPDEIYIICGHYDDTSQRYSTYAPGADDNGSGTISTLEAARALLGERFEATLRFVCFSREEQGLVGSSAYARKAANRGDSIIGAINFDMIAYVDSEPEDIDIIYNGPSLWMANAYEEASSLYVPDLHVLKRYIPNMSSSDQKPFWDSGYCSFCGIEDMWPTNPNYHTTNDRISTLDFSFYTQVVKGAVAMLADKARIDSVTSSVPTAASAAAFRVSPNPGRGEVSIEMAAGPGRALDIGIYDVSGRLVRKIAPSVDRGVARAVWHGDDASGAKVAAGVYFAKTQGRQVAKVVLIK